MFIELKNATKKYGQDDALVYALHGAELNVKQGEICVVLGPSGSGKSTLLNMLGGIDSLDEGELLIGGQEISKMSAKALGEYRRCEVGFVFQFYNLIADLTVEENIEVVAEISKMPLEMEELLRSLEIEKYRHRFPKELSGGQQQRVAIARAMIKNPKLLLCDELTGALDSVSSKEVLKVIEKMNKDYGTTMMIITHNAEIKNMADRIIMVRDGKIVKNEMNQSKVHAEDLVI